MGKQLVQLTASTPGIPDIWRTACSTKSVEARFVVSTIGRWRGRGDHPVGLKPEIGADEAAQAPDQQQRGSHQSEGQSHFEGDEKSAGAGQPEKPQAARDDTGAAAEQGSHAGPRRSERGRQAEAHGHHDGDGDGGADQVPVDTKASWIEGHAERAREKAGLDDDRGG